MLHSSTQKFVHTLCDLTASGAIAWKEDERGRVVFETEGYLVEVEADPPGVRLLHADGRELEYSSETDLAATPWPDGNGTYATHVAEMAKRANRIARGAEQAISKILSSLSAPPQNAAEPEPFPVALEFESMETPKETRRRPEAEPLLASHSVADAPPESTIHLPHAETVIAAVLAADPAPQVEKIAPEAVVESPPVEPEAEATIEAAEEELPLEEAPLSGPAAAAQTSAPAAEAPSPAPTIVAPPPATKLFQREMSQPVQPRSLFGETVSFARPSIQKPAPRPEPVAKVTSTGLFITGISATTRQTVRGELPPERPEPAPQQPVPAPVAQAPAPKLEPPAPKPEPPAPKPLRETAVASGSDIYKPWA